MAAGGLGRTILLVGAITIGLYRLAARIAAWRRLRHIPGPASCGLSCFWLIRSQKSGKIAQDFVQVCKTYGPLVRIAPDWVVTSDPREIRRIWSVHSGHSRSPWYRGLRFDLSKDSIITATDNREHGRLRNHVLPGYQGRGLENRQEGLVDAQLAKFLALIEGKYISSASALRPLDMSTAMQYLTQDVISAIEFGVPFGYLDVDRDKYGIIAIFESPIGLVMALELFPFLVKCLGSPLMRPLLPRPSDPTGPGRLLGLVGEHVDSRYGEDKIRKDDVLQSFVDSGLSRHDVESEALIHLIGGTDTTAAAMRYAVFFVASNAGSKRSLSGSRPWKKSRGSYLRAAPGGSAWEDGSP